MPANVAANYILKTGSAEPAGSVGITYGNEYLWRADAFYGFKIADGWYGSAGGFYRRSNGIRSPEFAADSSPIHTGMSTMPVGVRFRSFTLLVSDANDVMLCARSGAAAVITSSAINAATARDIDPPE